MTQKKTLKDFVLNYSLYVILLALLVFTIVREPGFLNSRNITNILAQSSTRAIFAMGIAGLVLIGANDLSLGRVVGCCSALCASLLQSQDYGWRVFPDMPQQPLVVALIGSIGLAVLFSMIIGFCVAFLHMHAFIASLGMQLAAYGILMMFFDAGDNAGQPISNLEARYSDIAKGAISIGGVRLPYLIFYMLGAAVIMWIIWNKTVLGKNMFAIGGNPEAAMVSGINIKKYTMLAFLLHGICVGAGSFLECARVGSVNQTFGYGYEFDAISAAVIGGVSFAGGIGTIPGVVIGVILLQTINYCLYFLGVNPYYQYIVRGFLIIVAVAIDVRKYVKKR